MATSKVSVTEGSGKNLATNSISEDAVTKEISRVVLNTSAGAEITPATTASDTSLAVIDDWDESDRAKVNPIVGQAGVAGGSGTVSALTQRVVLATDVALPAGTNAIGKLAANSGVDIGDVDVTSLPALPAGTNAIGSVLKKDTLAASASFTITLASLAHSAAGVGRQSTLLTGNTAPSALVSVKFTVGTNPTANTLIYVYLIRSDGTIADDAAGASDAAITIKNAPLLGTILCTATTSDATYYGTFDTKSLGSLGATWGIAVVNSTAVTSNSTAGNFDARYTLIT